ncbi:MAG: TRAP transporter small permease [Clostridiales bacterium]|nr:TRAP transporter small permease [Clostridiales bacterium]
MRKIVNVLTSVSLALSAISIMGMMFTITYDAAMRYIFKATSTIAYSLSEYYLMPAIVLFGLSYTQKMRGHTRVVFVLRFFNEKVKSVLEIVAYVFSLIVFALIGRQGFLLAQRAYLNHEIMPGLINWPMDIAYAIIPLGCAVMVLQLVLDIFDVLRGRKPPETVLEELDVRDADAKYQ